MRLPKLNNNDDRYTILEWCVEDGAWVPADAVVAVVESSKVAEDLVAPGPGILHQAAPAGADLEVGELIGYLFADEQERRDRQAAASGLMATPTDEIIITGPARALMEQLGLDIEQVRTLGSPGRRVVKRADVEALAHRTADPAATGVIVHRLPARQRAVADMVTRSHAAIPAAYLAVDIRATASPAQVIKAISTLRERFPLHFGSYRDDGTVLARKGTSIAVTIDGGNGLFMPVIRDVTSRSVEEVADALAAFRRKAETGSFTADELSDGNIGVSLHDYVGVVAAHPIVFPGHSCMLSVCAPRREVVLDGSGTPTTRRVFQLGMSYDHRVVNGRDAVRFLREIRSIFERRARRSVPAADGVDGLA